MNIWGEIKKAVNSTVGTDDFKPLDKIIKPDNPNMNIYAKKGMSFNNGNMLSIESPKGGCLHTVSFGIIRAGVGDKITFIVEADGVEVFKKSSETSTLSPGYVGMQLFQPEGVYVDSSSIYDRYAYISLRPTVSNAKYVVPFGGDNELPIETSNNRSEMYVASMACPLFFKHSLNIKITTNQYMSDWDTLARNVVYELFD